MNNFNSHNISDNSSNNHIIDDYCVNGPNSNNK